MSDKRVTVVLDQHHDYQFDIDVGGGVPLLRSDEPPPLGEGLGPSPVQLLASAVGNCLSDSLLFALRKFKQSPEPLHCEVTAEIGRNADQRLRVTALHAELRLGVPADALEHLERVLQSFEAYCTVTQSVAAAIPITVKVFDAHGAELR
ncbi:MAG: OsmC family protein [Burkholderiales bacterium]|nr:OsmC family protein [Burkholderiales bacterium]